MVYDVLLLVSSIIILKCVLFFNLFSLSYTNNSNYNVNLSHAPTFNIICVVVVNSDNLILFIFIHVFCFCIIFETCCNLENVNTCEPVATLSTESLFTDNFVGVKIVIFACLSIFDNGLWFIFLQSGYWYFVYEDSSCDSKTQIYK